MRIAIIGGGWYGCHLGISLLKQGHSIQIFEKGSEFFSGASGKNTNRLHLGFHYPRSKQTRIENIRCYNKFIDEYKSILFSTKNNLYGISKVNSYLDWETYKDILDSSGLAYEEIAPSSLGFSNLQGALLCEELFIDPVKARAFFSQKLNDYTCFNCEIDENYKIKNNPLQSLDNFDLIVDCTYGSISPFNQAKFKYEIIQLPVLIDHDVKPEISFVIMDGNFQSLSPYSGYADNLHYLYDVEYSPIFNSNNYKETSIEFNKLVQKNEIFFEEQIFEKSAYFYSDFKKRFSVSGKVTAIRTTLLNADANRSVQYEIDDKVIKILSGKISSIFETEEIVKKYIEAYIGTPKF